MCDIGNINELKQTNRTALSSINDASCSNIALLLLLMVGFGGSFMYSGFL